MSCKSTCKSTGMQKDELLSFIKQNNTYRMNLPQNGARKCLQQTIKLFPLLSSLSFQGAWQAPNSFCLPSIFDVFAKERCFTTCHFNITLCDFKDKITSIETFSSAMKRITGFPYIEMTIISNVTGTSLVVCNVTTLCYVHENDPTTVYASVNRQPGVEII